MMTKFLIVRKPAEPTFSAAAFEPVIVAHPGVAGWNVVEPIVFAEKERGQRRKREG